MSTNSSTACTCQELLCCTATPNANSRLRLAKETIVAEDVETLLLSPRLSVPPSTSHHMDLHQSVTELNDGSALFVTVAKYLSPALHEIDQVGIVPDVQCSPDSITGRSSTGVSSKGVSSGIGLESSIEQDSCVVAAEHQLGVF